VRLVVHIKPHAAAMRGGAGATRGGRGTLADGAVSKTMMLLTRSAPPRRRYRAFPPRAMCAPGGTHQAACGRDARRRGRDARR